MQETGMRLIKMDDARGRGALWAGCSGFVLVLWLLLSMAPARGAEEPTATPPAMDNMMSSQGWLQQIVIKLEDEAIDDIHMLPETPGALAREWRSFDRQGSSVASSASAFVASCGCGPRNRTWGFCCSFCCAISSGSAFSAACSFTVGIG